MQNVSESPKAPLSKLTRDALAEKRTALRNADRVLSQLAEGAAYGRDTGLREYVAKLRKRIVIEKQGWLPQKHFLERPANLFWVEGTSRAILYNYIPRGEANVYQVAYANVMVNLTRIKMVMEWEKAEDVRAQSRCQFVCDDTQVFMGTDLVWTHNTFLSLMHKDRIEFFANKYL